MKYPIIIAFTFLSFSVSSQELISGRVNDYQTGEPIPYVNIGIPEKGLGTVSDEAGYFQLFIPAELMGDTLYFSSIGYRKRGLFIGQLKLTLSISLHPHVTQLNEITIKGLRVKKVAIGSNTEAKFLRSGLGNGDLGGEIGTKIDVPKKGIALEELHFFLVSNSLDTVLLRLNIYPISGDFPKTSLLNHNIIVPLIGRPKGWIRFDLTSFQIELESDFIATLELVSHSKNKGAIYFSQAPPYMAPMYYRNRSMDRVKKYKGGPMGIFFTGNTPYKN